MTTTVLERPPAATLTEELVHEAPREVPVLPRISDAMRQGARYHDQARGHYYCHDAGTTCAIGAVAAGLLGREAFERADWISGASFESVIYEHTGVRMDRTLPVLAADPVLRPWLRKLRTERCMLTQAIAYLNDGAGWSREAIADWLESIGY